MFCKHCGKQVVEESAFCNGCGGSVKDTNVQNINTNNSLIPKPSDWLYCPKCKSKKLEVTIESTVTTTGGGYSASKGCLGGFLLGPLGLLCGSGGKQKKTDTTHETKWLCHDCGNRFVNPEEQMKSSKSATIIFVISGIILRIILPILLNDMRMQASTVRNINIAVVVIFAFFAVLFILDYKKAKATYETMKKEYENRKNI